MSAVQISDAIRPLTLKDLRVQCRARGLSPAGSQDVLKMRVTEHMQETNDLSIFAEESAAADDDSNFSKNNFQRPGGRQNVGNRITDRPSSKVLAPPGGASQIMFGDHVMPSYPRDMPAPRDQYPSAPPSAAQRAAESVLHNMGLGDTDALVAGVRDLGVAAGRPSHAAGSGGANSTSDRLFHTGAETPQGRPPVSRSDSRGGPPGLSQVSFGEYQLPSYVSQHGPEEVYGKTPSEMHKDGMVAQVDAAIRPLQMKELRTQCRARNLSPAGGQEALRQRLGEHMIGTGDCRVVPEGEMLGMPSGAGPQPPPPAAAYHMNGGGGGGGDNNYATNNYSRPGGQQNVGNFITDRASSRVLAPPGGQSQIMFGDHQLPAYGNSTPHKAPPPTMSGPPPGALSPYPGYQAPSPQQSPGWGAGASTADVKEGRLANNYARPNGQQNMGNFITDRPSSRVMQPPGGRSQITFG